MPVSLGGFSANHCAMPGMCDSNEPRMDRLSTPARIPPRFSKVVGDATRDKDERTSSGMRPRVAHQDTHGAFDDVENVVFRVPVSARTLRVGLKPPFRDGVARFGFGFVGLEDRGDAAHWIGTSLTGAENDSF